MKEYARAYSGHELKTDTINLKRLAQELNLSASTVSRALRGSHEISQETKDRVKALAEKLGFQPNPHASSLRQSKSNTIAVILPEIENNFFSQVMNGVEDVAQKKGYHVLIYLTHEAYERERDILQVLRNGRVDGMMISVSNTTTTTDHLQDVTTSGLPMVFFDRIIESFDVPRVSTDDAEASFRGTEHLIAKGAKKPAFFSMAGQLSISSRRQSGFLKSLDKHAIPSEGATYEFGTDDESNRKKIRELLGSANRPDAVFAAVEKLAVNTYEVCRELGIAIPEQLKVISFSNLSATALFDPPLTTIVQPAYAIGKEAADVLFKIIEKKTLLPGEKRSTFPSHIVERRSTGG